jgi:uncharacterized BrkB/YihY/UPF0761 family membrane protein
MKTIRPYIIITVFIYLLFSLLYRDLIPKHWNNDGLGLAILITIIFSCIYFAINFYVESTNPNKF